MRRLALFFVPVLCGAQARIYVIRPEEGARMQLEVEKTGFLRGKRHVFLFERYQGRLEFDPASPENSRIQLSIESNSASCKDTWVSAKDLRKIQEFALKDMLAAERYPQIRFASSAIKSLGSGRYEARGTLTVRDIPKPAIVLVSVDAPGAQTLPLQGSATVRLTDYGLKPPSAALGTIGTKDEMPFSFSLIARPQE